MTPKELLNAAREMPKKDPSDFLVVKTKSTLNGSLIGLVGGGMIGYYKGYNIYASCLIGALVCGVIANKIIYRPDEQ